MLSCFFVNVLFYYCYIQIGCAFVAFLKLINLQIVNGKKTYTNKISFRILDIHMAFLFFRFGFL